jgi:dihydrofolate synthase / folylpolyglutamate synthase
VGQLLIILLSSNKDSFLTKRRRFENLRRFPILLFSMTYQQTIDYLYAQLPMFQRIGTAAYKKDLTNTLTLCGRLDNPHRTFPTIHVAGTNGKGSVSFMLAAIFQAAGYKTGLYVSPHYKDFRERIRVNGEYITKKHVVQFVKYQKVEFETIKPSFFEMTVALAFDYFRAEKVDIAIIETGLGGRLDSTNIVSPLVSVITNISFDHTNLLGNTLELIAGEKAGIIKPKTPVVIGEEQAETRPVFERKALEMNASIVFASRNYRCEKVATDELEHAHFNIFKDDKLLYENLKLNATGDYQSKNLATVLQTIAALPTPFKRDLNEKVIRYGLENLKQLTQFMGRWQVIGQNPTIVCDSAHNEGGITLALEQLNQLKFNQLHIVIGFVSDKDWAKTLALFPKKAIYYFAKADIPRGLNAEILCAEAQKMGFNGNAYESVRAAFGHARQYADKKDLIFVGGSIFVVGEVL